MCTNTIKCQLQVVCGMQATSQTSHHQVMNLELITSNFWFALTKLWWTLIFEVLQTHIFPLESLLIQIHLGFMTFDKFSSLTRI